MHHTLLTRRGEDQQLPGAAVGEQVGAVAAPVQVGDEAGAARHRHRPPVLLRLVHVHHAVVRADGQQRAVGAVADVRDGLLPVHKPQHFRQVAEDCGQSVMYRWTSVRAYIHGQWADLGD